MYTCGGTGELIKEMGLLLRSWKLVWGLTIVLPIVVPNTAAGEPLIYNITLLRPWLDDIAEKPCEEVGYLDIICKEVFLTVQDEIGDILSVDFNYLGATPTLSGSTSLLFNTTTDNATHAAEVLTALHTLVDRGRVHALAVSSSVVVIPHPQTDLAVWTVNPVRGPSSGGTSVTINGFFTQDLDVYIGDQKCVTQASSLVLRICLTTALNNHSLINDSLEISFQDGGGSMRPSNFTYIYMTDPTLNKVQPLKVILSGAIDLTVSGMNLDIAQNRVLQTLVLAPNSDTTYTTDCHGSSATEMICRTAVIILNDVSKRRRRKRRQVESVNTQEMIDVQMTFILDGVSIQLSEYRTLQVFEDPVLVTFEPPGFTQTLSGNTITIQGRGLLAALTQVDYTVTVGGESCTHIKVLSSQIECEPPRTQPKIEDHSALGPGRIPVIVHYAGQVSEVGFLTYPDNTLRNILISVGVVLGCLTITLVSVGVYCYFQHLRNVSIPDPNSTPYAKPVYSFFEKPETFRKAPKTDGTARDVNLSRAKYRNHKGLSQHQSRYQRRSGDGQNGRQNQYGRHNEIGRPADPRPSRQVWPGTKHSGHNPGGSASYLRSDTVRSITQHSQRSMLPTPSRELHALVWNWDDHA